jgi:predicted anti-sigma-YlaC factor YlaD
MDCREHDHTLGRIARGESTPAERGEADRHRAGCATCRELHELMATEPAADDRAADLVHAVLDRTSGSACTTARDLLAPFVDGELAGLDAELVREHVGACIGCRETARALAQLAADLPALAEAEPDRDFVASVLARTAGRRSIRSVWESWCRRPRLAWELAYVATIAVGLAHGATGMSFAEVPRTVAGLVAIDLEQPVDSLEQKIGRGLSASRTTAERAVLEPSRKRASHVLGSIETSYGRARANVGTFVRRLASLGTEDDAPAAPGA